MSRVGGSSCRGCRATLRSGGTAQDAACTTDRWRQWIGVGDAAEQLRHLRAHTHTGWPLGADTFLGWLETLTGRRMRPRPRAGRGSITGD